MLTGFWYGDQKEGGHFEELSVDIGWQGVDSSSDSGRGSVAGCFECGNDPSVVIKYEDFLDGLRNSLVYQQRFCTMELVNC
jgi:hypothetical protein